MERKDARKMVASSAPNIVHSFDGAIAQATALYCKMNDSPLPNLMMIHDSFATTPNRIDDLHKVIRRVIVDLFSPDQLNLLYNEFLDQLPTKYKDKLPKPPERGNLELQQVENSRYFFS